MRRSPNRALLAGEVQEKDDTTTASLEIPGMEPDGLDLQVIDEHVLVNRGEKQVSREQTEGHYHVMKCACGQLERGHPLTRESGGKRCQGEVPPWRITGYAA